MQGTELVMSVSQPVFDLGNLTVSQSVSLFASTWSVKRELLVFVDNFVKYWLRCKFLSLLYPEVDFFTVILPITLSRVATIPRAITT